MHFSGGEELFRQGHRLAESKFVLWLITKRKTGGLAFHVRNCLCFWGIYRCHMTMSWWWRHTSSSCNHVMFLPHIQKDDREHTASLSTRSLLPCSLPPLWLTLHQLARPWGLRDCCWGCWKGTHARQSHWGHKGRGMDGVREGGIKRRTKVE